MVVCGSVDLFRMLMGAGVLARAGWVGSIVGQMVVVLKFLPGTWYLTIFVFLQTKYLFLAGEETARKNGNRVFRGGSVSTLVLNYNQRSSATDGTQLFS